MRLRGLLVACVVVLSTTIYGQEQPEPDKKDQELTDLKKQAAEQKKQIDALVGAVSQMPRPVPPSAEQQMKTARESYASVFKQARERGEAGCKDAGGKKFVVTIDAAGKPGASCEF